MPVDRNLEAWLPAANKMLEKELDGRVQGMCRELGLLAYHTHRSEFSEAGHPDWHIVAPGRGQMFRENKRQAATARASDMQVRWLNALASLGIDVGMWRPLDWFNGTITRELVALAHAPRLATAGLVAVIR